MILLDDGSNTTLGTQLDDLRNFINAQPATTTVGVAYMRDGVAQVVQNLTSDHSQAAKALRLTLGIRGVNGSPYLSLTDLVKRWLTPFLEDVGKRLAHQYLLMFLAKPSKKANWQRIRLMTEVPNADLVGPAKAWVTP